MLVAALLSATTARVHASSYGYGANALAGYGYGGLAGYGYGGLAATDSERAIGTRGGREGNEGDEGDEGDEGNEGNEGDEGDEGNEGNEGDEGDEGNEGDEGSFAEGSGEFVEEDDVGSDSCGGNGERPCGDTGCDKGAPAEAAGGVCVSSCGDPEWVCCDAPKRCLRHSLTCVESFGEDQNGVPYTMACVECGGEGEPICEEEGADECDDDLVNVDGFCGEEGDSGVGGASCGGGGERPCPDTGCDKGAPAEAAGGVCVSSCGDPEWVCCDAPKRCLRHSLTCVESFGEDQNGVPYTMACVECGGEGEPICEEEGADECDDDLVSVDGICSEEGDSGVGGVSCGGGGEPPCPDTGCDKGAPAEAAGGVCVSSCGDPEWVCCDAPKRCLRHSLTCVESFGEDQNGVPYTMACVECGGEGEPICEEEGADECDNDLVNIEGICSEEGDSGVGGVSCGGGGEPPCPDTGCDKGAPAEAAGGVCVSSCGDPEWVCCDAPKRCLRHSLTCVESIGEDQNGVPYTMACVECGGEGEPICEEEGADECDDDLVNVDDICT